MTRLMLFTKLLADEKTPFTITELELLMESLNITATDLAPYIAPSTNLPYGRTPLFRTEQLEAIVIHLPSYSHTYIHNHGSSVGCAYVAEGEVVNTSYRLVPGENDKVEAEGELWHRAGQLFFAPGGHIHRMSNPNRSRAVSLHLYSPPLSDVRLFEPINEPIIHFVI